MNIAYSTPCSGRFDTQIFTVFNGKAVKETEQSFQQGDVGIAQNSISRRDNLIVAEFLQQSL